MPDAPSPTSELPTLKLVNEAQQATRVCLAGSWTLHHLAGDNAIQKQLSAAGHMLDYHWDLSQVSVIDSACGLMLWLTWGEKLPQHLLLRPEHQAVLARWQQAPASRLDENEATPAEFGPWQFLHSSYVQVLAVISLLGQLCLDCTYLFLHPKEIPWGEISGTIHEAGVRALGITALVGFLIGIVLSYLSALQLKMFGAEIYIIDILGLSVIRELGPLLAAILVAGRSGSAMTAQIGIMRVTEELDALSAMGIAHSRRLILPKVVALSLSLPLLSLWTSATALLGGMYAAQSTLDISVQQFISKLPEVVPLGNLFIGLGKSGVFGLMIAIIACHYGFRIKPNTESLGNETTSSVVVAITVVILIDAIFAILFMGVGMP